jgi:transposase
MVASAVDVQSERLDDIPVLLHHLVTMGMPAEIDRLWQPHGNWQGLSMGWMATVWLVYIVTQQDHRMNHVRDWVHDRREALSRLIGQEIRETDFTDDRLALVLDWLAQDSVWYPLEAQLSQHTIRVYALQPDIVRLDATVGQVDHDLEGHTLLRVGRTKTGDYDGQFKLMLGALDPLGMPVAVDLAAGDAADDPLYVPVYRRIRQTLGLAGLLYVGDSKMSALETRATIQQGQDFYLTPLALVGETPALLTEGLEQWANGKVAAANLYLPADLPPDPAQAPDPKRAIAQGFETTIQRTAVVDGQPVTWTERLLYVQSFAYRQAQTRAFDQRLSRVEAELRALTPPPGRGRTQYLEEAPLQAAVEQVLAKYQAAAFFGVTLERQERRRQVRAYRGQPARTEVQVRYQVQVTPNAAAIAQARRPLGWRIYATNTPPARLALNGAVLAYRDQYLVERDFARLHGHLGITPLYVQSDGRVCGLVRLLTLALRALVLLEFVARRTLAAAQARLSGIYAGNPKRATARPTAERLLAAFNGITLTTIRQPGGQTIRDLTPLNPVQIEILRLLDMSPAIYTALVVLA